MTKKIIVGNWKMYPESPREAREIFKPIKVVATKLRNVTTVICPPAVFLSSLIGRHQNSARLALGAQDAWSELVGARTGKIGPTMLRNSGASHLILGHSEARAIGDSDALINQKIKLALKHNLTVILCVGERRRDYEGLYLAEIKTQLEDGLKGLQRKLLDQLVIAYEPVWAIGDKATESDTPRSFYEQSIFIRKILAGLFGKEIAMKVLILYGGSVSAKNASEFISEGQADGLLVGRASLNPNEFIKILNIADGHKSQLN